MASATIGEISACLVRVPVEVIKQRMQVSTGAESSKISSAMILRKTIQSEGILGLFRGYSTTVLREVPFSLIQMPLWEWLKRSWAKYNGQDQVSPGQSALCGAIAGTYYYLSCTEIMFYYM